VKFKCIKDVVSAHGSYFTEGKTYEGYENEHGELYATDDNGKNFNVGINESDEWYIEHFKAM
jgi:hypothetical protein